MAGVRICIPSRYAKAIGKSGFGEVMRGFISPRFGDIGERRKKEFIFVVAIKLPSWWVDFLSIRILLLAFYCRLVTVPLLYNLHV